MSGMDNTNSFNYFAYASNLKKVFWNKKREVKFKILGRADYWITAFALILKMQKVLQELISLFQNLKMYLALYMRLRINIKKRFYLQSPAII
jgi:hypothetical protein